MGVCGRGGRAGGSRPTTLNRVARVVPDIPTFAVDSGFAYEIPERLSDITIGSLVRIPLGGRTVAGFVVDVGDHDPTGLRQIKSARGAVFNQALLSVLKWAATHYVAPLSVLLAKAAPPNLPRVSAAPQPAGKLRAATALLANPYRDSWWDELDTEGGVVVVATEAELNRFAEPLRHFVGDRLVIARPTGGDAHLTTAWEGAATRPEAVLLGTPRVALWPTAGAGHLIAIEEGRRAMKDRQTPTLSVREIMRRRAQLERRAATFVGPTPTLETLAAGALVRGPVGRNRVWPLVEIVKRDADHRGFLTPTALAALKAVTRGGGSSFVFCHRRGYAPAVRCVRCRTVRQCPSCGARPDRGMSCVRCGAQLGPCQQCGADRFEPLGAGVGAVGEELRHRLGDLIRGGTTPITVGSEADLADPPIFDLAVAVDADGLMLGPNYRAAEEALRVLARLACLLKPGTGRRLIVQTALPAHPVIDALRRGRPMEFLMDELEARRGLGYPPAGELMILEVRDGSTTNHRELEEAVAGNDLFGPALSSRGSRWLIQGHDLHAPKQRLRPLIQRWRDAGASVRVDVDPIDL